MEHVGRARERRTITLEAGWTYRVFMADDKVCSFDLTKPGQAWILPPPVNRGTPTDASRQDWMLVIDDGVELQRGRRLSVHVFEDSGTSWTWIGSTPNRVTRASKSELPVFVPWR